MSKICMQSNRSMLPWIICMAFTFLIYSESNKLIYFQGIRNEFMTHSKFWLKNLTRSWNIYRCRINFKVKHVFITEDFAFERFLSFSLRGRRSVSCVFGSTKATGLRWKSCFHVITYLALFGTQVVHRSAAKFLQADLSAASVTTSSCSWFFSLISRVIVLLQVSLGLSRFLLPEGVQPLAWFGSLYCGIRRRCPYHLHRRVLTTSITDCRPVLLRSSSWLTWLNHLILRIFLKQHHSGFNVLQSFPRLAFVY